VTHPRHIREAMMMPQPFEDARWLELFLRFWLWLDQR
jgi:hypothetical protein